MATEAGSQDLIGTAREEIDALLVRARWFVDQLSRINKHIEQSNRAYALLSRPQFTRRAQFIYDNRRAESDAFCKDLRLFTNVVLKAFDHLGCVLSAADVRNLCHEISPFQINASAVYRALRRAVEKLIGLSKKRATVLPVPGPRSSYAPDARARLLEFMHRNEMSRTDLYARLKPKMSEKTARKLLNDGFAKPSTLKDIADVLGISKDDLISSHVSDSAQRHSSR